VTFVRAVSTAGAGRNTLLMPTAEADVGGGPVKPRAARLYPFNEDDLREVEKVHSSSSRCRTDPPVTR
jgi:hypothetical protein